MGPSPRTEGALSRLQSAEPGPLGGRAAEFIGEDAGVAFLFERISLQVQVLFAGGDAGISDVHGKRQLLERRLFVSDSSLGSRN